MVLVAEEKKDKVNVAYTLEEVRSNFLYCKWNCLLCEVHTTEANITSERICDYSRWYLIRIAHKRVGNAPTIRGNHHLNIEVICAKTGLNTDR